MAVYRCKKCEKQYSEPVSFCEECGGEVLPAAVCEECGTALHEGAAVCNNCGAPVEGMAAVKHCEECGAALQEGAAVCSNCGAPVGSMAAAAPAQIYAATAVPTAGKRSTAAFTTGNIIFLISLVPATVLLLSELFVFRATGVLEEGFGYFGFSNTFNYQTDLLDILERLGVDSLGTVRVLTGVFGFTWTLVVIALIGVVVEFIGGIANAGKGVLLKKICFLPLTYLTLSFLFCVLTELVLLAPVNDLLEGGIVGLVNEFVGFKLSVDMSGAAVWLGCIALADIVVYIVVKLIEKLDTRAR